VGTYATTTTLDTLMIGTTFDTATTNVAAECIRWSEDEIIKYLSKRYDISAAAFQTSTSIPPIVRTWCERMAQGYLHMELSRGGKEALSRGEKMIQMVLDNLEMVKDGELDILNTAGSSITENSNSSMTVLANTDSYAQTFDEDEALDWTVDADKLELISDERD
jgi:hypothetical protein